MDKISYILFVFVATSLFACGFNSEEKIESEKAKQDSIAYFEKIKADSIALSESKAAEIAAKEKAKADSAAKEEENKKIKIKK